MKKELLQNIASVKFGLNIKTENAGTHYCLQGKDFDENGQLVNEPHKIAENTVKDRDLLQEKDILFSAKGRTFSYLWKNEYEPAVATSTFLIVNVSSRDVLPEYLCWFISSPMAQRHYARHDDSTTVKVVNKSTLMELEVILPPLAVQDKIVKAYGLIQKEKTIFNQIAELKEKRNQAIINQYLNDHE